MKAINIVILIVFLILWVVVTIFYMTHKPLNDTLPFEPIEKSPTDKATCIEIEETLQGIFFASKELMLLYNVIQSYHVCNRLKLIL